MEQIYTIPVNEVFDASAEDHSCGCPMCALYRKLQENELELILGASMMEPDVRIKTNKEGFCRTHYDMMFVRKNRLGMALTLESHLKELQGDLSAGLLGTLVGRSDKKPAKRVEALERSCYVCRRIDFHFQHMAETVAWLFDTDENFGKKMTAQPYYCLPHYRLLLEKGAERFNKTKLSDYTDILTKAVKIIWQRLRTTSAGFAKSSTTATRPSPGKIPRIA